jgi:DNA polymerase III subunit epsilon
VSSWRESQLVVLDLEGTGAQDRDQEAILEIALVPLAGGHPDLAGAFATMINPGRPVPRKPWISPGLTTKALATAPAIEDIAPELTARLAGATIVGHNVNVDWRLLNRRCPAIQASALIDTLRLARHLQPHTKGNLPRRASRRDGTGSVGTMTERGFIPLSALAMFAQLRGRQMAPDAPVRKTRQHSLRWFEPNTYHHLRKQP